MAFGSTTLSTLLPTNPESTLSVAVVLSSVAVIFDAVNGAVGVVVDAAAVGIGVGVAACVVGDRGFGFGVAIGGGGVVLAIVALGDVGGVAFALALVGTGCGCVNCCTVPPYDCTNPTATGTQHSST